MDNLHYLLNKTQILIWWHNFGKHYGITLTVKYTCVHMPIVFKEFNTVLKFSLVATRGIIGVGIKSSFHSVRFISDVNLWISISNDVHRLHKTGNFPNFRRMNSSAEFHHRTDPSSGISVFYREQLSIRKEWSARSL